MSVSSQNSDQSLYNSGAPKIDSPLGALTPYQKILLNGMLTLDNPKDIPTQEIRYQYPTTGNTQYVTSYGGTPGQRVMKFNLPKEEDLVVIGPHTLVELGSVSLTVTGGTAVSNSGAALPNSIASLFDVFKVRVGSNYVHDITSNFGLLKRKLQDINCSMEWANGVGAVKQNYFLDTDLSTTGYSGFNKLFINSAASKRYQFGLLPKGFLDRYLPVGNMKPIEIELDLVSDPRQVVGFNYASGTPATAVTVTVNNPRLVVPCYKNKEMSIANTKAFSGYYDDFQSFGGLSITGSSTTATHQFPISRKSVSGLVGTYRVANDIQIMHNGGSDGGSYTLLDKQGQSSHLNLSQYYFRFNGQQIPVGEYIDATCAAEPYELLEKFAHEYRDTLNDENYYKYSSAVYAGSIIGGTSQTPSTASTVNPYCGNLSLGQTNVGGNTMCRFNLFHSFRADSALLYGIKTDQNTNLLELVLKSINQTSGLSSGAVFTANLQADYFIRYDVFYYLKGDGSVETVA